MTDKEFVLKLSRKFNNDEIIKLQEQQLRELQVEIGELKSIEQELEDANKELTTKLFLIQHNRTFRDNAFYDKGRNEIKKLEQIIVKLKKTNEELICRIAQKSI